jgi:DNA polymerase V
VCAVYLWDMAYIGLIDCNNFFVSCERLFRPDLVGKPVVVLSSNDGCVVARSQEVKDMGIAMGVPYFQIKDIIKDSQTTVFSSNFTLYRDISRRVFTVVRELLPQIEVYSIDEAFFCLVDESARELMARIADIKATVEQRVGVPVTIAVAGTKTQAKLVSSKAKKSGGLKVVLPGDFSAEFGAMPLREVWGVGRQLVTRYTEAGYTTVADLVEADTQRLARLFGVGGTRLQAELGGTVAYPLGSSVSTIPQSIMSTRSFAKKTHELSVIQDALSHHVREASADLRSQGLVAGAVSVQLLTSRHGDFLLRGGSLGATLSVPTASASVLLHEAMELLAKLYDPEVPYNKTGVVLTAICPEVMVPKSLFASSDTTSRDISSLLDSITARQGKQALQLGRYHQDAAWQSKQETLSPAYTTRWHELRTVVIK